MKKTGGKTRLLPNEELLECEKLWVFLVMIAVGGFLGAYTYTLKGRVFCNAQTANFLMLAIQLGNGQWTRALYYLLPITAYLLGAVLSEWLPHHVNRLGLLRWDTVFVAFEMAVVAILGFVPDDAPPQICQVIINFVASMQFTTFRQARGITMATTFCTNHLRQTGIYLVRWLRHREDEAKETMRMHLLMIASFTAAAVVSAFLCVRFQGRTVWFAELPLLVVLVALVRADRGRERDKWDEIPHGH